MNKSKTPKILPRSGPSPASHFKPDKGAGEKEQNHVAEFGEGNQNQQYLTTYNMRYHHGFIWAELVVSKKPR